MGPGSSSRCVSLPDPTPSSGGTCGPVGPTALRRPHAPSEHLLRGCRRRGVFQGSSESHGAWITGPQNPARALPLAPTNVLGGRCSRGTGDAERLAPSARRRARQAPGGFATRSPTHDCMTALPPGTRLGPTDVPSVWPTGTIGPPAHFQIGPSPPVFPKSPRPPRSLARR